MMMTMMDGDTNTPLDSAYKNKAPKFRGFCYDFGTQSDPWSDCVNNYFFIAAAIVLPISAGLATT